MSTNEPTSKSQILKESTRLFAAHGYSATSLQAICDAVGMRKASLLYHYPSKAALRDAVIDSLLQEWNKRLPNFLTAASRGTDNFSELFLEVAAFFEEDPNRARLILREVVDRPKEAKQRLSKDFNPWLSILTRYITDGIERGTVRSDVDPESFVINLTIMLIGNFAAADFARAVFDGHREDRAKRQVKEIIRIAKTSLFLPADKETL